MFFLFDTNIVLIYLRNSSLINKIERVFNPFGSGNTTFISVVTVGELKAISLRNNWGKLKNLEMSEFISKFVVADINTKEIINHYAEIDAFSQGKLEKRSLPMSARNMGKNDLWIAATASVLGATLLTTDNDFNHLQNEFLEIAKIDLIS